jgi:hypothetical protein
MAIAADTGLVTDGILNGLTEGYANIFNRMVGINFQVTRRIYSQVNKTMTRYLVQHVL